MSLLEVTVKSLLSPDEPQGTFRLQVSPDSTIESLLKQLCTDSGSPLRPDYLLCTDSGSPLRPDYLLHSKQRYVLDRTATLAEAGLEDGAVLHWTRESVKTQTTGCLKAARWIAVASLLIGAVGVVAVCIVRFKDAHSGNDFAIVFDAGSTHTSMFIYTWDSSKFNGSAVATQFGTKCYAGDHGIAGYENDPQNAGESLQPCLDEARAAIPAGQHSRTPVYLGATAGMRLLRELNTSASDAILDSVRAKFSESPFQFDNPARCARILSGSDEGTFSWITSNYVANAFKVNRPNVADIQAYTIVPSIGALDLGGASTQITFVPEGDLVMPANYSRRVRLFGQDYTVYTYSYLCYGVKEMSRRISAHLILEQPGQASVEHPCLPNGYSLIQTREEIFDSACVSGVPSAQIANYTFVGSSNPATCSLLLHTALFNFSSCSYSRCSFNGVYLPPVSGPFYAFSSFYYVSNFMNLSDSNCSSFHRQDFEQAIERLCRSSWTELQQVPVSKKEKQSLMFYCMQSSYINLLLSQGYNFTDTLWDAIHFVGKVSGTEVGWTLGFVLNESNDYQSDLGMGPLTFALLVALFTGLVVLALVLYIDARRAAASVGIRHRAVSQYGAI